MKLLERAPFLDTLTGYARDARLGSGRLVLVCGESGMGKTVLAEAFQQQLENARWLWGACDGLRTPRPLGPLFDIGPQAGGELAALCRRGAARDPLFTALLAELAAPGPLSVVVIEDLHWADEATADLLAYLGRRLARLPALVLATYRDEEIAADHPLRVVLGDLATQRSTRRMRLPPLSVSAVAALAAAHDVDAAELHRITGGNPFYVSEILDAGWPSIPPTVRDAVAARLARATPGTRRLVESAAVIGGRVDRELLAAALNGPGGASGDAAGLDEGLSTGILMADGHGLRFRHELVRMAVEASIPPHRTAGLHKRLLAALEDRGGADPALLAHHAEGANDAPAVRRNAQEAARRSAALGAHREAAAQFERALRFAAGTDDATLAALHEGLGGECALLDRWDEAEAALRAALRLHHELGDELSAGRNLWMLSKALWRLCRGEESAQTAEEAVRILAGQPASPELAWAYAHLSALRLHVGEMDQAIALGEQARSLGEQLGLPEIVSYAVNTIGCAQARDGHSGMDMIERALRIAVDADLHEAAGRAFANLQSNGNAQNRFAEAERFYAEGMAYCDERELRVFTSCLLGGHAETMVFTGNWDEAADVSRQLLDRQRISPVNKLTPLQALGTVMGRRGEPGAWDLLDECAELAEGTGEPQNIVPVRAARAELRWLNGRSDLVLEEVRSCYDQTIGRLEPWGFGALAIWLYRLGQPPAGIPDGLPEPYALEAAGDWRAAAAAWDRLGRPYDAALTRLGSADEDALRAALTALDGMGARAAAAVARKRMRDLGLRAIPRGPRAATRSAPAGLTAREQEILALVTEGLADREISRRLFISERTVQHHVSAVLSKIGVSSRAAAAREATRIGLGS
ncbi:MAG TPA: AAA family ATPase [Streptosporangiaceae bacterium]|nr:AAA family ATPase [Streptosporangiaceae bacterium]